MARRSLAMALAVVPLLAMAGCDDPQPQASARQIIGAHFVEPVLLKASDGVVVHGLDYRTAQPRAVVLLFHQAGSSKSEYNQIASRLNDEGFNALAIDQRSGGEMFGVNETIAGMTLAPGAKPPSYEQARPDLEAALDWAKGQKLPIILWGSSYSAAMVFQVAADHPGEIAAVMAFSPGEYLGAKGSIAAAAAKVDVPIYATAAKTQEEAAAAKAILAASPSKDKIYGIPRRAGVHGSSTLLKARNPEGYDENWKPVIAFLDKVAPRLDDEDPSGNVSKQKR